MELRTCLVNKNNLPVPGRTRAHLATASSARPHEGSGVALMRPFGAPRAGALKAGRQPFEGNISRQIANFIGISAGAHSSRW